MFGPQADADADAVARLGALEEQVRRERRPTWTPETVGNADGGSTLTEDPLVQAPAPPESDSAPPLRAPRSRVGLAVAVLVVLVFAVRALLDAVGPAAEGTTTTVEARAAYTLVRDPDARIVLRIPIEPSASSHTDAVPPVLPASGAVRWVRSLGVVHGWRVWIASADGIVQEEDCIAVSRGEVARARCVPAALRGTAALAVDVPYDLVPPADRPQGMAVGERLGFLWSGGDSGVYVLVAAEPEPRP
ncbi:hypothetical protein Microterr_27530 [Microbacterium terricola]|uniref:Uncharacterized protein n=1 Tax=Microbacterium terricola TaxID=344163 RepID=A0ABM8E2B1_9MICO|nr:hypothetical protein Microterr_27530 [Microbacterium terricola]